MRQKGEGISGSSEKDPEMVTRMDGISTFQVAGNTAEGILWSDRDSWCRRGRM